MFIAAQTLCRHTNRAGRFLSQATINDVASEAGVSIKTVSRVVNNEPNVREKTKAKVMQAIERLHYQPNQSARSLAANRSFLVGLLYANPAPSYIINAQTGALDACRQHNFGLLIHPCDNNDENLPNEIEQLVRKSRLDGLILTPPLTDNPALLECLQKYNIDYVSVSAKDEFTEGQSIPNVLCDDEHAAATMTEHLLAMGHQRIGFIAGHPEHNASEKRLVGYRSALAERGINYLPQLVEQGLFDFNSGKACAEKLLDQTPRPTAIFASNDYMASGVLVVAHNRGIKIPAELSVVGFDDVPIAAQSWPALTTIRQPSQQMVEQAAQFLIAKVSGKTAPNQAPAFRCELIERDSCAPPKN